MFNPKNVGGLQPSQSDPSPSLQTEPDISTARHKLKSCSVEQVVTGVGRLEGRVDGDGVTSSDTSQGLGLGDAVVGEMFGEFDGSADVGYKRRNTLVEIIEYTNSSWE